MEGSPQVPEWFDKQIRELLEFPDIKDIVKRKHLFGKITVKGIKNFSLLSLNIFRLKVIIRICHQMKIQRISKNTFQWSISMDTIKESFENFV